MKVKQGRLWSVFGILLIVAAFIVLGLWIVVGPTVYNSVPFLAVGMFAGGTILTLRRDYG